MTYLLPEELMRLGSFMLVLGLGVSLSVPTASQAGSRLHLEEYVADSTSFNVVSTLIVGPTEVMLVDAQMTLHDGRRVADMLAATKRRVTGIFITHPDEDHTFGLQPILERFPGTPVYMTAAGRENFAHNLPNFLRMVKSFLKKDAADSVPAPQVLPSTRLTVDGEVVEVTPDLQGDVIAKTNSFLYIPSLGAVIAGDIVFAGVHPFLAHSTPDTRTAWQASLQAIAAKHPRVVVPGHKPSVSYPNSPDALDFMSRYLREFDELKATSADPGALAAELTKRHPDLAMPLLLQMSARSAFRPPSPGGG